LRCLFVLVLCGDFFGGCLGSALGCCRGFLCGGLTLDRSRSNPPPMRPPSKDPPNWCCVPLVGRVLRFDRTERKSCARINGQCEFSQYREASQRPGFLNELQNEIVAEDLAVLGGPPAWKRTRAGKEGKNLRTICRDSSGWRGSTARVGRKPHRHAGRADGGVVGEGILLLRTRFNADGKGND